MKYVLNSNPYYSNQELPPMAAFDTNDENLFSRRIRAGKRTYFFDVKATKSAKDYFIVITENCRLSGEKFEKHKLFPYKEDFRNFFKALDETVNFVDRNILSRDGKSIEV